MAGHFTPPLTNEATRLIPGCTRQGRALATAQVSLCSSWAFDGKEKGKGESQHPGPGRLALDHRQWRRMHLVSRLKEWRGEIHLKEYWRRWPVSCARSQEIPSDLQGVAGVRDHGLLPGGAGAWHVQGLYFFFTSISLALFAVSASKGSGRRDPVGQRPGLE